jgi:hypothetical protein
MKTPSKKWLVVPLAAALVAAGFFRSQRPREVARAPVEEGDIVSELRGVGTLEPRATIAVGFPRGGRLLAVGPDVGAVVHRDAVLARAERDEEDRRARVATASLQVAQATGSRTTAELRGAEDSLAQARRDRDRAAGLVATGALAPTALDAEQDRVSRAETARSALVAQARRDRAQVGFAEVSAAVEADRADDQELRAPADTVVLRRLHEPGDVLPPGGAVFLLADPSDLVVRVPFDESALVWLALGVEAEVRPFDGSGAPLPARLLRILPEAQSDTHEIVAEFSISSRGSAAHRVVGIRAAVVVHARSHVPFRLPRGGCSVLQDATLARCAVVEAGRVATREVPIGRIGGQYLELRPGSGGPWPEFLGNADFPVGTRVRAN